jgi:hypothetical protein
MKKQYLIVALLLALVSIFSGCSAVESPSARVTLESPHVATETGLKLESELEPGSYAVNQVLPAGTYERGKLREFAPGPLPRSVSIEPGNTPSPLETGLAAVGTVANSIPGGQPIGTLFLGLVGIAKIWRDSREIKSTRKVAQTLAASQDSIKDVFAALPDRALGQKLESEFDRHIQENGQRLKVGRDLLDAILNEMATPSKKVVNAS